MSLSLTQDLTLSPTSPLLIVDVDEVLALFMAGLERFIARQGYEMRIDRFALFQNIYRAGETQHIDLETGRALFDAFFREGADDLHPVEGAADALADLSRRAGVVILTNAPDCGREARTGWLARHGFDYPMILNSGVKGPMIAELAARTSGPVVFIDDLLPNLESSAESAPHVLRFQSVADPRLRPLAPQALERHPRHDEWTDLKPAIEAVIRR